MYYLKELTDWETPNHTYIMQGSKCIGYIKQNTTKEIMFNKPMFFDRKGRKFKKYETN